MSIAPTKQPRSATDPRRKRWTVNQYHRLADYGFFQGHRVELLFGTIYCKDPGPRECQPWQWTRKEYYRLWELGFIPNQRVQLINGEIYLMLPQKPPHSTAVSLVQRELARAFGPAYTIRTQLALVGGNKAEPEPDISVVPGQPRDYLRSHPKAAVLVVEVSDSTLAFDRKKALLYARAKIAEYWIVNLLDGVLEVYRQPTRRGYKAPTILEPSDAVSPLALPKRKIRVADLLP